MLNCPVVSHLVPCRQSLCGDHRLGVSDTPVMLNRDGISQAGDEDPKYSRKGNYSGADVCWNILNHLDDGVSRQSPSL